MKKIIAVLVLTCVLMSSLAFADAVPEKAYPVTLKGKAIAMDVPAGVTGSTVYLPVKFIGEALGYTVAWHGDTQTATLERDGLTLTIFIGENRYDVRRGNGITTSSHLSGAPIVKRQRTLVPAEFFPVMMGHVVSKEAEGFNLEDKAFSVVYGTVTHVDTDRISIATAGKANPESSLVLNIDQGTLLNPGVPLIGDEVVAITSTAYTGSLPPMTLAYGVYKVNQTSATVGRIVGFGSQRVDVLVGDTVLSYFVSDEMASRYYVGQRIEINALGAQTTIKPHPVESFKKKYTNLGDKIYTVEGTVSTVAKEKLTLKTSEGEVVLSYSAHPHKIGDALKADYIVLKGEKVVLSAVNTNNKYTLKVSEVKRSPEGHMLLTASGAKGKVYRMTVGLATKLEVNLSDIAVGSNLFVYTNGIVEESFPAQITPVLIQAVTIES